MSGQIEGMNLRGGRRTGRCAGEKQLGMNECYIAGQIRPLDQGRRQLTGSQRSWNSNVRDLANAAGPVAMVIRVDVAGGDDNKKDGKNAQGERQNACCAPVGESPVAYFTHAQSPQCEFDAALPDKVTRAQAR